MRGLLHRTPGSPARMVEYHLGFRDQDGAQMKGKASNGKALRPTLALLTADATGGQWEKAVPAASALELFHNFTLIHDDIQDGDETRHGKPTVWALWGKEQAINAGDAAHLLSSQAVLGLADTGYSAETTVQAHRLLTDTGLLLATGQAQDMGFETRMDVTVEEYLAMIAGKTGALIETSIRMGALLGSADEQTTSHLGEYGRAIGVAFQIGDDGLGIWGDGEKTGKPVGADIKKRKKSYPIVWALNQTDGAGRKELEAIYQKNGELDDSDVERVLTILDDVGSQDQTRTMTSVALERAVGAIDSADINRGLKKDYIGLAGKLANRQR
jgi:geranylgeranyl diphosphate synthase type I